MAGCDAWPATAPEAHGQKRATLSSPGTLELRLPHRPRAASTPAGLTSARRPSLHMHALPTAAASILQRRRSSALSGMLHTLSHMEEEDTPDADEDADAAEAAAAAAGTRPRVCRAACSSMRYVEWLSAPAERRLLQRAASPLTPGTREVRRRVARTLEEVGASLLEAGGAGLLTDDVQAWRAASEYAARRLRESEPPPDEDQVMEMVGCAESIGSSPPYSEDDGDDVLFQDSLGGSVPTPKAQHQQPQLRGSGSESCLVRTHSRDRAVHGYVLGEKLGRGAFGTVWKAMDPGGTLYALKQMDLRSDADTQAAQLEYSILKMLNHRNVVKVWECRITRHTAEIVMTYWTQGSIYSLVQEFGALSDLTMKRYLLQLLSGLEYLHSCGIVHGDIKPQNMLVDSAGAVALTDFGLCTNSLAAKNQDAMTGGLKGTLHYLSRSLCLGTSHTVDSDVWAMGCSVLDMLTCLGPWRTRVPSLPRIVVLLSADTSTNPLTVFLEEAGDAAAKLPPLLRSFVALCFHTETMCDEIPEDVSGGDNDGEGAWLARSLMRTAIPSPPYQAPGVSCRTLLSHPFFKASEDGDASAEPADAGDEKRLSADADGDAAAEAQPQSRCEEKVVRRRLHSGEVTVFLAGFQFEAETADPGVVPVAAADSAPGDAESGAAAAVAAAAAAAAPIDVGATYGRLLAQEEARRAARVAAMGDEEERLAAAADPTLLVADAYDRAVADSLVGDGSAADVASPYDFDLVVKRAGATPAQTFCNTGEKHTQYPVRLRPAYTLLSKLGRRTDPEARREFMRLAPNIVLEPSLMENRQEEVVVELSAAEIDKVAARDGSDPSVDYMARASPPVSAAEVYGEKAFRITVRELKWLASSLHITTTDDFDVKFIKSLSGIILAGAQGCQRWGRRTGAGVLDGQAQYERNCVFWSFLRAVNVMCVSDVGKNLRLEEAMDLLESRTVKDLDNRYFAESKTRWVEAATEAFTGENMRRMGRVAVRIRDWRRDVQAATFAYGFPTSAAAKASLDQSLSELCGSLCVSQMGYFLVEGRYDTEKDAHSYSQLTEKTPLPVAFLSATGIDFSDKHTRQSELPKYFKHVGGGKYEGFLQLGELRLQHRLKDKYRSIFAAATHHGSRHLSMLPMGLGVFLHGMPPCDKQAIIVAYLRAQCELLCEEDWGFHTYYLSVGPPRSEMRRVAEAVLAETTARRGALRCNVLLHSCDAKYLAVELARRGQHAAVLNPSDPSTLLLGLAGSTWEVGRYHYYTGEQDMYAHSTAVLAHGNISLRQ